MSLIRCQLLESSFAQAHGNLREDIPRQAHGNIFEDLPRQAHGNIQEDQAGFFAGAAKAMSGALAGLVGDLNQ